MKLFLQGLDRIACDKKIFQIVKRGKRLRVQCLDLIAFQIKRF